METTEPARSERPLPERVAAAHRQAEESGFTWSCIPEVGRLLTLATAAKPAGIIAESGTGVGVGTAWLQAGLGAEARLLTVDHDPEVAARAAALFADDSRVEFLVGDWRLLEEHAPFDVFFCDGGGKREDPQRVVELLAPGGLLIMDDFTPSLHWPPLHEGGVDELRLFYLGHPQLSATEVMTTPGSSAIIATRLP
ncbi:class I SAM-dependent methyltransferase [Catenulispora yoronensis]|uniref:Class I SAM-dependent methyltransferase n=1 Tax=Catenulispora yoronensis TaxID=450799 RepID=A0ABP5GPV9_9ACTN